MNLASPAQGDSFTSVRFKPTQLAEELHLRLYRSKVAARQGEGEGDVVMFDLSNLLRLRPRIFDADDTHRESQIVSQDTLDTGVGLLIQIWAENCDCGFAFQGATERGCCLEVVLRCKNVKQSESRPESQSFLTPRFVFFIFTLCSLAQSRRRVEFTPALR